MTRRDYELIAQALKVAQPDDVSYHADAQWEQHNHVCNVIAGTLKADNPAFDYALFMVNAGMRE